MIQALTPIFLPFCFEIALLALLADTYLCVIFYSSIVANKVIVDVKCSYKNHYLGSLVVR